MKNPFWKIRCKHEDEVISCEKCVRQFFWQKDFDGDHVTVITTICKKCKRIKQLELKGLIDLRVGSIVKM